VAAAAAAAAADVCGRQAAVAALLVRQAQARADRRLAAVQAADVRRRGRPVGFRRCSGFVRFEPPMMEE